MSPIARALPALLALLPGVSTAFDVPLRRAAGGQPLIEARTATGQTVACLFDTGATRSVLAPGLLNPVHDRRLGEIGATGAGGTGRFASWRVHGWQLGEHALPAFAALAADLGTATPCVLGPSALGQTRIELDFVDGRLRAAPESLWKNPDPSRPASGGSPASTGLPYESVQGFIRLRLPFPGGTTATWVLDTGAGTTVLNRRAAALLGLDPTRPAALVDRRGLDGRRRRHRVHGVASLALLPGSMPLSRVEVAELPVLARLGIDGSEPGGLLGADALQGRRWILDLDRRRLELQP